MSDAFWSLFRRSNTRMTTNRRDILWDEPADVILREWWPNTKIPAEIIGQKMTPNRSKNAVIGRAKRLGLPPRRIKSWSWDYATKPLAPRKSPKPSGIPLPLFPEPQNWTPIRVSLLEASRHHCRAIIESSTVSVAGQTVYCGCPKVQNQPFSFCRHHLALYTTKHIRRR